MRFLGLYFCFFILCEFLNKNKAYSEDNLKRSTVLIVPITDSLSQSIVLSFNIKKLLQNKLTKKFQINEDISKIILKDSYFYQFYKLPQEYVNEYLKNLNRVFQEKEKPDKADFLNLVLGYKKILMTNTLENDNSRMIEIQKKLSQLEFKIFKKNSFFHWNESNQFSLQDQLMVQDSQKKSLNSEDQKNLYSVDFSEVENCKNDLNGFLFQGKILKLKKNTLNFFRSDCNDGVYFNILQNKNNVEKSKNVFFTFPNRLNLKTHQLRDYDEIIFVYLNFSDSFLEIQKYKQNISGVGENSFQLFYQYKNYFENKEIKYEKIVSGLLD